MLSGIVWTALPLSGSEINDLERSFAKLLSDDVTLEARVNESLIGGVRVEVGGRVFDGSLKNQLAQVLRALTAEGGGK